MRWQQKARFAIGVFVLAFAGLLLITLRRHSVVAPSSPSPHVDPKARSTTIGGVDFKRTRNGKLLFAVTANGQKTYDNGRSVFDKIKLTMPDREGRTITVTADEGEVVAPTDDSGQITTAHVIGNVSLKASDGMLVTSHEATYSGKEEMLRIPGPVQFARGRMSGKGVGATYDTKREVLWLLDQAVVSVAPDEKGSGKIDANAGTAGLARAEHYFRLSRAAHVVAEARTIDADEITGLLTSDDQRVESLQLRGNSRITGSGASAQNMSAKDIDLTYGADGRTLQRASLMEQAVVELTGSGSARRIAGRTIQIGMGPDGATVVDLRANDNVQLDLPAVGEAPARQIRSATLAAGGPPGAGLQTATFEGAVEYREVRGARRGAAASERLARSQRLIVQTQPNLGDLQQADFHGNVRFEDGQTKAQAQRGVYAVDKDRLDLSSAPGDQGPAATVTDPQVIVTAVRIALSLESRKLSADTDVRSTLQPHRRPEVVTATSGRGGQTDATRMPSMLKQDEPVNVTANTLEYDSAASQANYSGNARLWQGDTTINADRILIDDKSGNLTARGNTRTRMIFEDVDPKTKQRTSQQTTATAENLVYDDAKRLAVYTAGASRRAHIVGPQGDLTGDRIELYLDEQGKQLERLEAYTKVTVVQSDRTANGDRLTYTATNDVYVMAGAPVEVVEQSPSGCRKTLASTVRFSRGADRVETEGTPQSRTTACDSKLPV